MSASPTILFQSHNRRGLGHLMRAINVAREMRTLAPDARIVVHARNPSAGHFCPPDVELVIDMDGGRGWRSTVRDVEPDIIVYDTLIPDAPDHEPIPSAARVVYIMRRCSDERHRAIQRSTFLQRVDVAVVPHEREQFDQPIPAQIADRVVFVGPIVRAPTADGTARLRRTYGLGRAGIVVVSCAGGGGFAETAEPFFDAVWDAHRRLAPVVAGLRHIVVLGPHQRDVRTPLPGMTVVASEPDLVDLFALADLVVSEGGYNSVNEIRLVGVPACFVPGRRSWDDQAQRVQALEAQGLAVVVVPGATQDIGAQIARLARDADRLAGLRDRCAASRPKPGNRHAAQAILGPVEEVLWRSGGCNPSPGGARGLTAVPDSGEPRGHRLMGKWDSQAENILS